jgi:signal transduction histidine kinase
LLPSLIEAMPTASYAALVGEDGSVQVTALSPGLERLTGHPPALFQDQDRWQRCIDWTSYPPGQPLPERLLHEAEAEVEYRLKRADGRWMWLRETCRVVARDAEGIEVVGALQDVTREHDLARQAEQASRAATQGIVAAGLAHDLKGPLQTISFAAQNGLDALASGTAGTEEVRQRLLRVVMQSERASAIARQLGDFTKLESLRLEPVQLPAAVRAVMGEVAQPLQEAGVEVQLRLADNLPPVRGLGLMVEQVLVNLCLNARDAMVAQPEGQRVLRLAAIFRADTDQVEVTVSDSGGGLPPALLERVFEMHFTTKERSKGSGLGLTLCRFLMTRFGGSITLRNVPGGAEARLVFRRAQVLAPPPLPQPASAAPVPGDAPVRASAAG